MPRNANAFDNDAAKRIARTVRAYENQLCADGVQTPEGQACAPPARPRFTRGAKSVRPVWVRFKSQGNDYIVCRSWNGSDEGDTDIYIAKPWKLRHTASNYETITTLTTDDAETVTVSDGDTDETWKITPSYEVDDELYYVAVAGTGVTVSGVGELGKIDINVDGRAWAVDS